jgi:hypothetical protein
VSGFGTPRGKSALAALRRSLGSYTVRQLPDGLLENLEVRYELTGELHLAPHLSREPTAEEVAELERVLNQAVDDLVTRLNVLATVA